MVLEPQNYIIPDCLELRLTRLHALHDAGVYMRIKVPTLNVGHVVPLQGHSEHNGYDPPVAVVVWVRKVLFLGQGRQHPLVMHDVQVKLRAIEGLRLLFVRLPGLFHLLVVTEVKQLDINLALLTRFLSVHLCWLHTKSEVGLTSDREFILFLLPLLALKFFHLFHLLVDEFFVLLWAVLGHAI